ARRGAIVALQNLVRGHESPPGTWRPRCARERVTGPGPWAGSPLRHLDERSVAEVSRCVRWGTTPMSGRPAQPLPSTAAAGQPEPGTGRDPILPPVTGP